MIRGVRVINPNGEDVLMRLDGSEQGPFSLWSIEGLDQGEAEINIDEIATVDGAIFNSARQASRELTITAILNDSTGVNAIQYAREQAYKYFPLKKLISIIFYLDDLNGGLKSYITEGYVKSNPVDIFAKRCATRVTIVRTKPFFYENYAHGEFFDVYDKTSGLTVNVNDSKILTDFADHTYRFNYGNIPYYWNMFIDESSTPILIDIRKSGITTSTPSSDATFKIKRNNYINYKISRLDFEHYYTPEAPYGYSISPTYSTPLHYEGADIGIRIELVVANDISYQSLTASPRPVYIENVSPLDKDKALSYIGIYLNKLIVYPDFAQNANDGLKAGDKIIISTSIFEKDVRYMFASDNKEISVLGITDFTKQSELPWPYIKSGDIQIKGHCWLLGYSFPLDNVFSSSHIYYSKAVRGI